VWWQVSYNGVTGWTAESLNGVYFLQPYGVGVAGPSAGGAGATGSNFTPKGPAASLVLPPSLNLRGSRAVISTANVGQLQNAGEFLFPEYIGRAAVANNGTLVTWISGAAGYNNLLFYDSLANFSLSSSREQVFSSGGQSFLAISPAGDVVALGISATGAGITSLSVQDRNGAERLNLPQNGGSIPKAAFNSDSSVLAYIVGASGSPTSTLNVANVSFQTTRALSNTQDFVTLAFSNDGSLLAAIASNGQVTLWDGRTLAERGNFATGLSGREMSIAINANGTRVAVAGNTGVVQIWDATSRTKVLEPRVFQATQSGIISALAFSPNGSLLAAGGYTNPAVNNTGNNVVIFDANSGTQLVTLIGLRLVFGLGFSAAGDVLMGYDDYSITFWTAP
jgi:WD40 repeat protein